MIRHVARYQRMKAFVPYVQEWVYRSHVQAYQEARNDQCPQPGTMIDAFIRPDLILILQSWYPVPMVQPYGLELICTSSPGGRGYAISDDSL